MVILNKQRHREGAAEMIKSSSIDLEKEKNQMASFSVLSQLERLKQKRAEGRRGLGQQVDHYLNAIKRSILQGTSRTSIDMSVKDAHTLIRLGEDVVPHETLRTLGMGELGDVNARYDGWLSWKEGAEEEIAQKEEREGLKAEDKVVLLGELEQLGEELLKGNITVRPYAVLMGYLKNGVTYEGSAVGEGVREWLGKEGGLRGLDGLREACLTEEGKDEFVVPFPITYLVLADITEVKILGNTDRAPATANELRSKLSHNFKVMLAQNQLTPHQQMSLYRILGPERNTPKAAIEVNNIQQIGQQQIVIVKDAEKLKPTNLVVGENAELLGIGKSYGNINKNGLLKLASGEVLQKQG